MSFNFKIWVRLALINLLLVATLGVIMRYKIGFEFPYFNQKNLQHAHSHFAFSGWISLMIMLLMLYNVRNLCSGEKLARFSNILFANNVVSYGMLVSFAIQGYAVYSITFSTLSILVSFWFCFKYYFEFKSIKSLPGMKWLNVAMLFNLISTLGTFSLSYMMATKQIDQHSYLASVYWYLHFQYNGWFFFACIGFFVNYLHEKNIYLKFEHQLFYFFALACIPAYGLSTLWLNLPWWLYLIVVVAALAQAYALIMFYKEIIKSRIVAKLQLNIIAKLMLICAAIALGVKVMLQLGSTVSAISKFAFGFRPIVIAYLHLVLLAFISVFLIAYCYYTHLLKDSKMLKAGLFAFLTGIVVNELLLGLQGVFSITYTMIPMANEILFLIALLIFFSLLVINFSQKKGHF